MSAIVVKTLAPVFVQFIQAEVEVLEKQDVASGRYNDVYRI